MNADQKKPGRKFREYARIKVKDNSRIRLIRDLLLSASICANLRQV